MTGIYTKQKEGTHNRKARMREHFAKCLRVVVIDGTEEETACETLLSTEMWCPFCIYMDSSISVLRYVFVNMQVYSNSLLFQ